MLPHKRIGARVRIKLLLVSDTGWTGSHSSALRNRIARDTAEFGERVFGSYFLETIAPDQAWYIAHVLECRDICARRELSHVLSGW